jgi:hypothetical protein
MEASKSNSASTMAIISLVLGILGLCTSCTLGWFGFVFAIPAGILGYLAMQDGKKQNNKQAKDMGTAGLALAGASLTIGILYALLGFGYLALSLLSINSELAKSNVPLQ